jgi:excisionase family DNA binding protein
MNTLLRKRWKTPKAMQEVSRVTVNRNDSEVLLTPSEVAAMFRVDPKTVTRWAKSGKLTAIRTLGGHRRYRQSEVQVLLENNRAGGELK